MKFATVDAADIAMATKDTMIRGKLIIVQPMMKGQVKIGHKSKNYRQEIRVVTIKNNHKANALVADSLSNNLDGITTPVKILDKRAQAKKI